jgi:periplasmic divalent cation tolerance protein
MPEKTGCIVIFVTVGNKEEAERIAKYLLDNKKAACVSMVSDVSSSFWWRGKIDSARESLLVIKTVASALQEVVKLVKEVHSYEVPEIIALPIIGGNDDYLKWITNEVK